MSILYLTQSSNSIDREGARIILRDNGEFAAGLPVRHVEGIVVSAKINIPSAVIQAILQQGSYIVFTDWQGKYKGMLCARRGDLNKLKVQICACSNKGISLKVIKYILQKKIDNQVNVLRLFAKYRKSAKLKKLAEGVNKYPGQLEMVKSANEARGIEGICAKEYFSAFDEIIDKKMLTWKGRNRQPASDPVNSLLSYGYAFLEREVRLVVMGMGLDERYGFLHINNGRKDSLIYDVMELFRQSVIDRLVLNCFSRKIMKKEDFCQEGEACNLTEAGRKKWIEHYEKWLLDDVHGRKHIEQEISALWNFIDKLENE